MFLPLRFSIRILLACGKVAAMGLFGLGALGSHGLTLADDWRNWRGPHGNGTAEAGTYPLQWNMEQHVAWKRDLPERGASTPIVVQDRILLTVGKENRNVLMALDRQGNELWSVDLGEERKGKHAKASGCNSSPVADDQSVFAYFKSGDLACCRLDGSVRWKKNLQQEFGEDTLWWDLGTSPILVDNLVVIAVMQSGPSFLVAFHKETGELAWKSPRQLDVNNESNQSYTTPTVQSIDGNHAILTLGADHLTAHRATDGKELWRIGGFNPENHALFRSIASPVIDGSFVFCPYARGESLTAVRLPNVAGQGSSSPSEGDKSTGQGQAKASASKEQGEPTVAWRLEKVGADVPTPVVFANRVVTVSDKGVVHCLNQQSGEVIWREELPRSRSQFSSSPILANQHLYLTREDGTTFVLEAADQYRLVSTNELEGTFVATPVFSNGQILIRSLDRLYCIE